MTNLKCIALVATLMGGIATPAAASVPPEIDAFAMLPVFQDVAISPDGKGLAVVRATSKAGNYILEIYDAQNLKAKPLRAAAERMEITGFTWINNRRLMVTFRQKVKSGARTYWANKTAFVNSNLEGAWLELPEDAEVMSRIKGNTDELMISYQTEDENYLTIVARYNVMTGRKKIVLRSNDTVQGGFFADADGEVRGATGFDAGTSSIKYYARAKGKADWQLVRTIDPGKDRETFNPLGLSEETPNEFYVITNNGEDKAGVYAFNIETKQLVERLFAVKPVDVAGILTGQKQSDLGTLQGFTWATGKTSRYIIEPQRKALQDAVDKLFPDKTVALVSRSDDDNVVVLRTSSDRDPGTYYILRNKAQIEFLGEEFPLLKPEKLARVEYTSFTARDGLTIPAYITTPEGKGPFPAVVMPHGGPWARDFGGFDEWTQLLASQGYVVIQPQFRGSDGFGLKLWKAGDGEWGLKMQDDNDDAAKYLVEKGLADPKKLAIFGWSYGGYAAFAGSMRENNIYRCAIAGAGVSDLSLLNAGLGDNRFLRKFQRPTIKGVSPYAQVEKVNVPMLIVHGDIDQRVDIEHSRRFVKKMVSLGKPHTYIELEGADHFYNTLSYEHKTKFYTALTSYLKDTCFK